MTRTSPSTPPSPSRRSTNGDTTSSTRPASHPTAGAGTRTSSSGRRDGTLRGRRHQARAAREARCGAAALLLLAGARAHPGADAGADARRARHGRARELPARRLRGLLPARPGALPRLPRARARDLPLARLALLDLRLPAPLHGAVGARRPSDARRVHPPRADRAARASRASRRSSSSATCPPAPTSTRIAPPTFEALRHQASLQLEHRRTGLHRYELLAARAGARPRPPPGALAGRPLPRLRGRPVLHRRARARVPDRAHGHATAPSRPSGHTASTRRSVALEQLIDLLHERLAADPGLHVYHYAPYELTALTPPRRAVRDARGRARRAAPPRGLRRPLRGRAPGAPPLAPRATRSSACGSSS